MIELPDIKNLHINIDKIANEDLKEKKISLSVLRLDKIHHDVSGNKFFKLYYFLKKAIAEQKKIITFGGAYSNHLAATASACKMFGIKSIGIIRGENPESLSNTLLFCIEQGMQLKFISRKDYEKKDSHNFKINLADEFGNHILIPEGGFSKEGVAGAAIISNYYQDKGFTHICCAVGTATTLAGLTQSAMHSQTIIGFSALKQLTDFSDRFDFLIGKQLHKRFFLNNDYHFGGYAKKNS